MIDPATGKIIKTEKYGLSPDVRSSADLPAHVAVIGVRVAGDFVFDKKSGRAWGMLPTRSHLFGLPFVKDGKFFIQTLSDLIVLDFPNG